jgi:hypothetical protein
LARAARSLQTGTVERLRSEIEVLSGTTLDDPDVIRPLTRFELQQRRQYLADTPEASAQNRERSK